MISYDLNKPNKDYSSLYAAIKGISGVWWHHLTSDWLVDTSMSTDQVAKKLRSVMDSNDELLVIRVQRDFNGYLSEDAWKWLRDRVY